MAKMKVRELAEELNISNDDIKGFLSTKGIEVKRSDSGLDDDAVAAVRGNFKSAKAHTESAKEKTPIIDAKNDSVHVETQKNETPHAESAEAPKKKKNIIFVSNPHNSNMSSRRQGNGSNNNSGNNGNNNGGNTSNNRPQNNSSNNDRNGYGNNQRNNSSQPYRPLPKPVIKPVPITPTPKPQPVVQNKPKPQPAVANTQPVIDNQKTETAKPVQTAPVKPVSSETQATSQNSYQGGANRSQNNSQNRTPNENRYNNNGRSYNNDGNRSYNNDGNRNYNNDGNRSYNNDGNRSYNNDGNRSYNNDNNRSYNNDRRQGGYSNQNGNNQGGYNNQNGNDRRPYNNNNGSRPNGDGRTGNGDGQRRYGDRRPQYGNNNGQYAGKSDNRGGYDRSGSDRNGSDRPNNGGYNNGYNRGGQGNGNSQARPGGPRPFNNNERGGRSDGRPQNGFRKPQGAKNFDVDTPIKEPEKKRDEEKRRIGQERDKRSKKDHIYEDDNAALLKNKNKAGRFIKPEKKEEVVEEQIKVITIPETITIKELAEKMKIQPSAIVKKLFLQGKIVTVNQEVDFEQAEEIAIEYEIICEKEVQVDVIEELLKEDDEKEEDMVSRPPVICVMGHVDHGKTSLLDAIRKTNVTNHEAGGITQHIGAYTVTINGEKITFLDTPGHEAFTAMRMRGANSTDIAILVVAADDGVMPQTVEAINHAKAAGIEIIVAVNKIDKPNANIDRVKQELTEYELIPVDWGGTTEFVPVSAKSGEGIDTLLETIILTSEILELKANPDRRARGLVIEAELDKGRGPVATVLVQKGTLHVGDFISAGAAHGKVRAMIDDKGRRVKDAAPSTPVEILGLSDVPNAGEIFIAHENDKTAKSFAETFVAQNKVKKLEETKSKMSLDDLFTQIQAGNLKELNLIIKADVQGSVEAVKQSLLKLSNEEVVVKCIHGGVGAINESDVILASASQAIIIGFNVRPDAQAKTTAEREGVDVRLYKVIYQAIEDVEAAMKGMLDPVFEEKIIGHAEVRQIFKASSVGNIAGSYVLDGTFERGCKVRITREGDQVFEGDLASLKRFKDDVKEVKAGFECGLVFDGFDQMQELDIVEAYKMVEVPR